MVERKGVLKVVSRVYSMVGKSVDWLASSSVEK